MTIMSWWKMKDKYKMFEFNFDERCRKWKEFSVRFSSW